MDQLLEQLRARKTIIEIPFRSRLPLIGGAIAWLRTQWNRVSTQWYVRPLLQQQNEVNALWTEVFSEHMRECRTQLELLEQDQMEIVKQVAGISYRLECIERIVSASGQHDVADPRTEPGNTANG